MGEFLTDLQCQPFLRYALLTGVLASVACGVVGTYVVARRISYIAGGISHSVLAGMGAARYLETVHHWNWLHPLHGAVAAALAAALVIGVVSMRAREREDTVIGAVWAVGMAIGVLFIRNIAVRLLANEQDRPGLLLAPPNREVEHQSGQHCYHG